MGKVFRFESMWLKDPRYEDVVRDAWEEGLAANREYVLGKCLESCRATLETWNKEEFGHVGRRIAELQKHLECLELQPASPIRIRDIKATRIELNGWLEKEGAIWLQRSRIDWFQFGDRNIIYFHARALAHLKKNLIEGLLDSNDVWQEEDNRIEEIMVDYYRNLFTSSNTMKFDEILQAI